MANKISKFYPWVLLGGSSVGLVASVWQAAERVEMLKYPGKALTCNLNPVIDCGGVLSNRWSSLFGFPNAFIGIAMFAMLFMAAVGLLTGTKFSRGFQRMLLGVSTILILFSLWFFSMSLYVIGKVCIFCLFIWAVALPIFWYGKLVYFQNNPPRNLRLQRLFAWFQKHHLDTLALAYAILLILYFFRFRSYYFG